MNRRKVLPAVWMLISAILVFSVLLIYLNVLFFKQEKEKIEAQSNDLIAQTFFAIPYNTEGLDIYATNLIKKGNISEISDDSVRTKLQDIFTNYKSTSLNIDTVFKQMNLDVKYDWTVSISKFETREFDKVNVMIDSKNDPSKELVLFGKGIISSRASNYSFYRTGCCHFNQINLHINFTNIYKLIAKRLTSLFVVDFLLILLFILIIHRSIKTLLDQHKMMVTQTDLLNTASHEFNTPLSSIKLGGQTLLRINVKKDSNVVTQVAQSILKQQKYLQELVDQILVLDISENQGFVLEEAILLTNQWIEGIITKWLEDKDETEVLVEFKKIPNKRVMVDPYLLKLSLFNILNNTLKYSNKNPVHIHIQGISVGKKLHIEIQDNGLGMSPLDVENAFKKFYRGTHYHLKKPGFGLGLYLVNRIIKLHKGSCKIESKLGKGTKIIIILPIDEE